MYVYVHVLAAAPDDGQTMGRGARGSSRSSKEESELSSSITCLLPLPLHTRKKMQSIF